TPGTISGTLTYVEPATLSPTARALVVLVEGAGKASAGSVVASEMIIEPAQVPVPFTLDYSHVAIDQDVTYTLQATIVDGDRTWVTTTGTPVITRGNPTSGLTLALTYRADALKGDVTGSISGVDITLGDEAFSAAVLLDLATDTTVGIDVHLQPGSTPIRFAIPFDPAKIDPATDYVVAAGIVDQEDRWVNREGVPVITKGNPISDVTVPVSAVALTTAPTETDDGRSALVIVLLALGLLAAAIFIYQRSRLGALETATTAAGPGASTTDEMPEAPADAGLAELVAEPEGAEPEGAEPEGAEPGPTEPDAAEPGPIEPDAAEPAVPEDERAPEDVEIVPESTEDEAPPTGP
ncbi:MAG TPA: YbaY family lipoprotein, partial [Candidatus Limnocylindrales bacterium]|nr:YbaY family lipoprotein [Candidatus Limnocylindrales bacterium]